jgi:ubiquinone/menaquinone biosynthesis C-methylase UbiE
MTVLEPGGGMGFFSLPLARLVGAEGRVVCVDLQPRMVDGLRRRARKAGLLDRLETAVCSAEDLGIGKWEGRIDLALVIHVIHEVPDPDRFLRQIHAALRPGGRLVVIEPKGHVRPAQFGKTLALAETVGFRRDLQAATTNPLQATLWRP